MRETVQEFTSSWDLYKELRLTKLVQWDYGEVERALTDLARSTGYRRSIHVEFPTADHKVVVWASNVCSTTANSMTVRILCCLSCLMLCVAGPATVIARLRMKKQLTYEYRVGQIVEELRCDSTCCAAGVEG